MKLKHMFLAAALIAAAGVLSGCVSNQIGDSTNSGRDSTTGPTPVTSPSPVASPSPSPKPSASPSVISSLRNGPYGQDVPVGETKPPNNLRPYPICLNGCVAVVTATPKAWANDAHTAEREATLAEHGKDLRWSVPVGADVVSVVYAWDLNGDGFNVRVSGKRPGTAILHAELYPPDGGGPIKGDLEIVIS